MEKLEEHPANRASHLVFERIEDGQQTNNLSVFLSVKNICTVRKGCACSVLEEWRVEIVLFSICCSLQCRLQVEPKNKSLGESVAKDFPDTSFFFLFLFFFSQPDIFPLIRLKAMFAFRPITDCFILIVIFNQVF